MPSLLRALPMILAAGLSAVQEAPSPKTVLDLAARTAPRSLDGGQGTAAFWEDCDAGTEATFCTQAPSGLSKCTYRLDRREARSLTLLVDAKKITVEMPGETRDPFTDPPKDAEIPGTETLHVGEREFVCRRFERTVRSTPQCGNDERRYSIFRIRAWRAADVRENAGLLKIVLTWEADRGGGLKVDSIQELVVTDLTAKRRIGGRDWDCTPVSVSHRTGDRLLRESTQWRLDSAPGGILEEKWRYRGLEGDAWSAGHVWVENLTIVSVPPKKK